MVILTWDVWQGSVRLGSVQAPSAGDAVFYIGQRLGRDLVDAIAIPLDGE
jgi:hypothetical protein